MSQKAFIPLENNPEVFTHLSHKLGLSLNLRFYDVFSFDAELTSQIPRPIHGLVVIIPMTPAWRASRQAEDAGMAEYTASGPNEPVMWFKQTIKDSCGLIALLHCCLNGSAKEHLRAGSTLEKIREQAVPLKMMERAAVLEESTELEEAHKEAALMGDTVAPENADNLPFHFVAFVRGDDGALYELEGGGTRKGPLKRGWIGQEDLLGSKALELGISRQLAMGGEDGNLRFSCIALAGE